MATHEATATPRNPYEPDPRHPKTGLPAWILGPVALVFIAVAAVYAFSITFSQFAPYDDQGTVMVCVLGYLEGHPLYDSVRLAYGPFYFIYQAMFHHLTGLPVTHDFTGILCIAHWLAAGGVLAWAGARLTRSKVFGLFVFMQAVVHLRQVAWEPGHPQEVVVLFLALAVLIVATGPPRGWRLAALGILGAALVFTKINVGAFFVAALLMLAACYAPLLQDHRRWFWGLLLLSGLLPLLLMREHLAESWARDYSAVVAVGVIASGAFTYTLAGERRLGIGAWLQTSLPFGAVSALLLLAVLANGTSLPAMLDNLVRLPASLPRIFLNPLLIPNAAWSALASLLVAAVALRYRGHWQRLDLPIAALKATYGVLGCLLFVTECRTQLGYLLPWLWLAMIPVPANRSGPSPDLLPRAMLCLVAAWQGLQAYPVAGTQVCIATFLAVLVYSLCAHDALLALAARPRVQAQMRLLAPRTAILLQLLLLASLLHVFTARWCQLPSRWDSYASAPALDLHGARFLHLPAHKVQACRTLAHYLEKDCDTFIVSSLFNSLYLWTEKRPPTWFNILGGGIPPGESQQAQVVAALRQAKRPLILVRENQVPGLLGAQPTAQGPLIRYLREDCREVEYLAGFRILAPKRPADRLFGLH